MQQVTRLMISLRHALILIGLTSSIFTGLCGRLANIAHSQEPSQRAPLQPAAQSNAKQPVASRDGVIVVRPADWAHALTDWKSYRTSQGHQIYELDAELGQVGVQSAIVRMVESAKQQRHTQPNVCEIGYVVLIGDSNLGSNPPPLLPAWYRESTAMVKFGGDEQLATDNPYADIDGDERPDLAIGRIPADSPEAARQYLQRSVAYERQLDFGLWRRDVRVVAGVGGFGALADSVIEMTTSRFLTDRVPAWCDVSMTYASPNSPFCPDPYRFSDVTLDQLNVGSQFWVYVGHGHIKHLDFVRVEDDVLNILMDTQIPRQKSHARPPIALLLACYTGAFDAREDCLSEQMVMSPGGPVASIAATRVTGPYGLATMTSRMLDECYVERTQSLGQVFLSAKQQMLLPDLPIDSSESPRDAQMQLITAVASALSPPGYDLLAERREHVWQVNLLGDPLLRLNHPDAIELKAPSRVLPGEPMAISGLSLQSGKVTVELTLPRDRSPKNLYVAGKFSADAQVREKMHSSYALANQRTLVSKTLELALPGPFECELQVPMDVMPGRYIVRVFIEGKLTCSAGSTEVQVARKRR